MHFCYACGNHPSKYSEYAGKIYFCELGINIERLTNVTRGEYGYVMVDLSHMADDAEIEKLRAIEGVLKVRVMK